MRSNFKPIFVLIFILVIGVICFQLFTQTKVETVNNCKVINLQQQSLVNGDKDGFSTTIRYLVITDKETFVCETSPLNMKFNNSDIFWRLQKDSTYNFKVAGIGKSILTEYRNILSYEPTRKQTGF